MIIDDRVSKLERLVEMLILDNGSWGGNEEGAVFKKNREKVFRMAHTLLRKKVKDSKCKTCGK